MYVFVATAHITFILFYIRNLNFISVTKRNDKIILCKMYVTLVQCASAVEEGTTLRLIQSPDITS